MTKYEKHYFKEADVELKMSKKTIKTVRRMQNLFGKAQKVSIEAYKAIEKDNPDIEITDLAHDDDEFSVFMGHNIT